MRYRGIGALLIGLGLLSGCSERQRLTFGPEGTGGTDQQGPRAFIEAPAADTSVDPGTTLNIAGRVHDEDRIDSIYIEVHNPGLVFAPSVIVNNQRIEVSFSAAVTFEGAPGDTLSVWFYATDLTGARGDTAVRKVALR
ncbi:MAG TPA: hypothetical protein VFL95_06100 [Gemmatimonadales bacterium]|nr:hypothetical protein [Gemmatimonadales bacterium]